MSAGDLSFNRLKLMGFVDSLFMMHQLRRKIVKAQAEMMAYNNIKQYTHQFGDFIFYKSMNFRSSYLENLAEKRNEELNKEAKAKAAEYFLEVMILQYTTLLFNCERKFLELINYTLYHEFIIPLFEGKTFDQYLIILMVRSLANVIFKKIWLRLVVLRQRLQKTEQNAMKQKEASQERRLSVLAMSAAEQINLRVEKILEPKLESLLSEKVKKTALKTKPYKKEQQYKLKYTPREQRAKEPRIRDVSVESGSTLASFAKRQIGVELSGDYSSDEMAVYGFNPNDDRKPSGKGKQKSSGKDFASTKGNHDTFFDCYGMDVAPLNLFENQVIPVRIHNISKSFSPNLNTIRVLSLGTKFIPKWKKTKTTQTFKWFNDFKNKLNRKVYHFYESKPGVFEKKSIFHTQKQSVPLIEYTAVNTFC